MDLMQAGKGLAVQDLGAVGPVEAFNAGVLGWLVRLDVQQLYAVALRSLPQRSADELRAGVGAPRADSLARPTPRSPVATTGWCRSRSAATRG